MNGQAIQFDDRTVFYFCDFNQGAPRLARHTITGCRSGRHGSEQAIYEYPGSGGSVNLQCGRGDKLHPQPDNSQHPTCVVEMIVTEENAVDFR